MPFFIIMPDISFISQAINLTGAVNYTHGPSSSLSNHLHGLGDTIVIYPNPLHCIGTIHLPESSLQRFSDEVTRGQPTISCHLLGCGCWSPRWWRPRCQGSKKSCKGLRPWLANMASRQWWRLHLHTIHGPQTFSSSVSEMGRACHVHGSLKIYQRKEPLRRGRCHHVRHLAQYQYQYQ